MTDLISRLEAAESGSLKLDALIDLAAKRGQPYKPAQFGRLIPEYTTSLDAALTLVPEGWGTSQANTHQYNDGMWQWGLWRFSNLQEVSSVYVKKTPALALVIAALKARQEMGND